LPLIKRKTHRPPKSFSSGDLPEGAAWVDPKKVDLVGKARSCPLHVGGAEAVIVAFLGDKPSQQQTSFG
jgi:hypothetical protein